MIINLITKFQKRINISSFNNTYGILVFYKCVFYNWKARQLNSVKIRRKYFIIIAREASASDFGPLFWESLLFQSTMINWLKLDIYKNCSFKLQILSYKAIMLLVISCLMIDIRWFQCSKASFKYRLLLQETSVSEIWRESKQSDHICNINSYTIIFLNILIEIRIAWVGTSLSSISNYF